MLDNSVKFGMDNFFYVESNETDGAYDYVSYMTKNGTILIARFPKDGSSARYVTKTGVYATVFAGRAGYTYVLPNALLIHNIV